jgi:Holliday junction resolvase RusA-like endonuclease
LLFPVIISAHFFCQNEGWFVQWQDKGQIDVSPRGNDVDNMVTALLDALVDGGVLADDSLVMAMIAEKHPGEEYSDEDKAGCLVSIQSYVRE